MEGEIISERAQNDPNYLFNLCFSNYCFNGIVNGRTFPIVGRSKITKLHTEHIQKQNVLCGSTEDIFTICKID